MLFGLLKIGVFNQLQSVQLLAELFLKNSKSLLSYLNDAAASTALVHVLKLIWTSKDVIQNTGQLLVKDVANNPSSCVAFLKEVYSSGESSTANELVNLVCNSLLKNPEKSTKK